MCHISVGQKSGFFEGCYVRVSQGQNKVMSSLGSYLEPLQAHSGFRHNPVLDSCRTEVPISLLTVYQESFSISRVHLYFMVCGTFYLQSQQWAAVSQILMFQTSLSSPSAKSLWLCLLPSAGRKFWFWLFLGLLWAHLDNLQKSLYIGSLRDLGVIKKDKTKTGSTSSFIGWCLSRIA